MPAFHSDPETLALVRDLCKNDRWICWMRDASDTKPFPYEAWLYDPFQTSEGDRVLSSVLTLMHFARVNGGGLECLLGAIEREDLLHNEGAIELFEKGTRMDSYEAMLDVVLQMTRL